MWVILLLDGAMKDFDQPVNNPDSDEVINSVNGSFGLDRRIVIDSLRVLHKTDIPSLAFPDFAQTSLTWK